MSSETLTNFTLTDTAIGYMEELTTSKQKHTQVPSQHGKWVARKTISSGYYFHFGALGSSLDNT